MTDLATAEDYNAATFEPMSDVVIPSHEQWIERVSSGGRYSLMRE